MQESSDNPLPQWSARQVFIATVLVIAVVLAFAILYFFRVAILLLFIAIVLATAMRPAIDWLYSRQVPRATGVILIYLLLVILLAGFALMVLPFIAEQVTALAAELPIYYAEVGGILAESPSRLLRLISWQMPSVTALFEQDARAAVEEPAQTLAQVPAAFAAVQTALRALVIAVAVFIMAFYWTLQSDRIITSLLLLLPLPYRAKTRSLIGEIENKVGGFLLGQFTLMVIVGAAALVAYLLIGLPYALPLAILAGIFEAVPMIGPLLGALAALLVASSLGTFQVVMVLVASVAIQLAENYLLVPRVMRRSVGINSLLILLAMVAFSSLMGFAGVLLAIPITAILQLALEYLVLNEDAWQDGLGTRDRISRMRYELHDVVKDTRRRFRQKSELPNEQVDCWEDSIESIASQLECLLAPVAVAGGREAAE